VEWAARRARRARRVACWDGTAWATIGTAEWGNEIDHGVYGAVYALALAPSGELYAAGASGNSIGSNHQAGNVACWDGHRWQFLGLGPYQGALGTINALAVVGGRVYAAGNFQHPWPWKPGDPWRNSQVAMWDGSAWQPLDPAPPTDLVMPPGPYGSVAALTVDPVGEVYIGGGLVKKDQQLVTRYLARWTGKRWDNLPQAGAQGLDDNVLALAVAAGNRIYAGGAFEQAGTAPTRGLALWNGRAWAPLPAGCLADSNRQVAISALAVATDGQLYAGVGAYTQGPRACRIARWDGHDWYPLGTGLQGDSPTSLPGVQAIVADPRGGVYVCGEFSKAGGLATPNVARWNGKAWETLGTGLPGSFYVYTLAVAPNGDLYAGGHITLEANKGSFALVVRWNGSAWSRVGGFADSGTRCQGAGNPSEVYALTAAPTGELYVGGIFSAVDGVPAHNLARWDGTAWHAVGDSSTLNLGCQVHALALAPNGDLYVGGEFENSSPIPTHNLARWDGRTWHAVGPGFNGPVLALACASGNRLIVGGSFTTFGNNSVAASHFAVLDPTVGQLMGRSTVRSLGPGAKRMPAWRPRPARR